MLPPPLPNQIGVLQRVLDRVAVAAADGGPAPICIFGLDGVLYDSRPRTLQVLLEYAAEIRAEDPELAAALSSMTIEQVRYLLSDTLRECGVTHADVLRDVTAVWRERFYTDDYALLDQPTPGAVEFVRAIHGAGGSIIYFSGRDVPSMLLGTLTSLRDHGFPIASVGVQTVLKPDATLGTEAFKRRQFPRIGKLGDVIAVFDQDPMSCEQAKELFPNADVALVDTWHEADEQSDTTNISLVRDFRL